jgi:hypothetical protein
LACAFCISPLATIDFQLIHGVYEVYTDLLMLLGMSIAAEIVVAHLPTHLPQLFWLDRKMVDFSKWLASRLVQPLSKS